MPKTIRYLIIILFLFPSLVNAQLIEQNAINQTNANQSLELENYAEAVRQFKGLYKKDSKNEEYKFKLGIAYTFSNISQARGLEILEELFSTNKDIDGIEKYLAIAYFKNYEFEKATNTFETINTESYTIQEKKEISDWIIQCKTSSSIYAKPIPLLFENLGKTINSNAPDYYPMSTSDESNIIFTTRRSGVVGNLFDFGGYRTADIFIAKHKSNKYSRARSIGSPNTYGNEETAGTSESTEFMIYHVDSDENYSDLFVSKKGRRSYMPAGKVNSTVINQKPSNESGASITNDGNILFFCSNREGGLGGYDLYMARRLPNLEWADPINLGSPINTPGDEKFPHLRNEGSELYFSSNGHKGMGGLDLFKSVLVDNQWTAPVNLGYPLNTVNDDPSISFAENKRYGYIATKRDDSFGDLDIYRITFLSEREELTLIKGSLRKSDSSKILEELIVEILNEKTGDVFGSYISNKKTGNFLAILPPGRYLIEIYDDEKYKDHSVKLVLHDKNDFTPKKSIQLTLQEKPKLIPKVEPANKLPEIEK